MLARAAGLTPSTGQPTDQLVKVRGIKTTIPFQQEIIAHPDFAAGTYDIGWVARYLEERKA